MQDYYGVNKLKQASQKTKYINRHVFVHCCILIQFHVDTLLLHIIIYASLGMGSDWTSNSLLLNRFPVPLSLEVIELRLENNYYRSLDALEHDFEVMLSNAESYLGKNVELSTKLRRLSEWFQKNLSNL